MLHEELYILKKYTHFSGAYGIYQNVSEQAFQKYGNSQCKVHNTHSACASCMMHWIAQECTVPHS